MKNNIWHCQKKDVTKKDVDVFIEKAYEILTEMFIGEFGTDVDGDIPVDFYFINRIICEPIHFFNVPYSHLLETAKEKFEKLCDIHTNLSIIQDRLDTEFRILIADKQFNSVLNDAVAFRKKERLQV